MVSGRDRDYVDLLVREHVAQVAVFLGRRRVLLVLLGVGGCLLRNRLIDVDDCCDIHPGIRGDRTNMRLAPSVHADDCGVEPIIRP